MGKFELAPLSIAKKETIKFPVAPLGVVKKETTELELAQLSVIKEETIKAIEKAKSKLKTAPLDVHKTTKELIKKLEKIAEETEE